MFKTLFTIYNYNYQTLKDMKNIFKLIFLMGLSVMGYSQNTLRGYVYNSEKQPIPNVSIICSETNSISYTSEDGKFEITNLPQGKNLLIFNKEGYEIYNLEIDIEKKEIQNIDEIILEKEVHHIDEIMVSTIFNKTQKENIIKIDHININKSQNIGAVNLTEILSTNPGITNNSTGNSIGKPVIRGLSGNRILTFAQGIRLENQQFGEEHGLGLNSNGLESVEIIKGPASLLYGSDAMGGVLYFNPEKYSANNTTQLELDQKYFSNTQGISSSIGLKTSTDKFRFLWNNNYTSHADYLTPQKNQIINTRFIEKDIKIGSAYETSKYAIDLRYNYNNLNLGLPEIDLEKSRHRTPLFPSQKIDNHLLSLNQKLYFKNSKIESTIGYIFNNRKELESDEEIALFMKLKTFNYNIRYYLPKLKNIETIFGIQGLNQSNRNFGQERLIPNSIMSDFGIFTTSQLSIKETVFQAGIRFDYRKLKTEEYGIINSEGYFPNLNKTFKSFNSSIGMKNKWNEKVTTRLNIASGFRAPNLSELTSNGVHEGSNRYEIGNINLENEKNIQLDFSLDYKEHHFDFFFNSFYNHINNYIYIQPNGELIDSNNVFLYVQNNARLYGGETGIHLHPHPFDWLHFTSSYEMVIGQLDNSNNLPLIPANQWKNNLKANFNLNSTFKNTYISLQANYTFNQNLTSEFEENSKDYFLINSSFGTEINLKGLETNVFISATNLFNKTYIPHLSRLKTDGVPNMGRNIIFGLNLKL